MNTTRPAKLSDAQARDLCAVRRALCLVYERAHHPAEQEKALAEIDAFDAAHPAIRGMK